jgi:hypothetical protein
LAADFQGWQIVAANHPLQSARRDLQQLRRLSQGEQSYLVKVSIHR